MKRKMLIACFLCLFSMLLVGFDWTEDDPGPLWNTETVHLSFDDNYTANGRTLIIIEGEILNSTGVVVQQITISEDGGIQPDGDRFRFPIRQYVESLPDGIYHAHIRVCDNLGNFSGWSEWIYFQKAWQPLPPPGGCALMR